LLEDGVGLGDLFSTVRERARACGHYLGDFRKIDK
jgi:hypothetical protein